MRSPNWVKTNKIPCILCVYSLGDLCEYDVMDGKIDGLDGYANNCSIFDVYRYGPIAPESI